MTDSLRQGGYRDGDTSRFAQMGDQPAIAQTFGNPVRQNDASASGKTFQSHIGPAGIGTEDELFNY